MYIFGIATSSIDCRFGVRPQPITSHHVRRSQELEKLVSAPSLFVSIGEQLTSLFFFFSKQLPGFPKFTQTNLHRWTGGSNSRWIVANLDHQRLTTRHRSLKWTLDMPDQG